MDASEEAVEFEMMLVGRHSLMDGRSGASNVRLDRSAYTILSRMSISGPMSIGQLSEAFGLDTSTVNRQTAALVRDGLAERIADPDGGLARKFRLTDEGYRRMEQTRHANLDALHRIFDTWDPVDVEKFADLLTRYNSGIERIGGRVWPRPGSNT